MNPRTYAFRTVSALSILCVASVACSAATDEESSAGAATAAVTSAGSLKTLAAGTLASGKAVVAGSDDNPLSAQDKQDILTAWRAVKANFYDGAQPGYSPRPGYVVPTSEPSQCLGACPNYYSDLVCHYYCTMPAYASVSPNIRGCFTNIARGGVKHPTLNRNLYYPEIYDYCLFQDYDYVQRRIPAYDQNAIDTAKNANPAQKPASSVLFWIDQTQSDVFQKLMYTWYNPFAFNIQDQQDIINSFYGVANPNDANECRQKRPRTSSDPYDGSHCRADARRARSDHPDWSNIYKFMAANEPQPAGTTLVTFAVDNTNTKLGESIHLLGDASELGYGVWPDGRKDWRASRAIALDGSGYPTWKVTVPIQTGKSIKFKFAKRQNWSLTWEGGGDRTLTVPATPTTVLLHWQP